MIGILEHIEGRKLTVSGQAVYLRKGFDSSTLLPLLQADVEFETVEEKGFQMVESIKVAGQASLPKTEVEKTKPVDMPASANVPKLDFMKSQGSFTSVSSPDATVKVKVDNRTQKDHDITACWAMGAALNSPALAQCNDAMALSTEQTIARAKKIADELKEWVFTHGR